ncbi:two-component system, LuxR family, sensor kinase FixL [Burkholderia sp. GAS332]|nr:two-component system, LuxR family, sensor kinase FixL [Burkholderia sp. GAS332]
MIIVMPAVVAVLEAAIIIRLLILMQALRQRAKQTVSGSNGSTKSGFPGFGFSVAGVWSKVKDSPLHRSSTGQRILFRPPGNGWRHNARRTATRRAVDTIIHRRVPRESPGGTRSPTWRGVAGELRGSSGNSGNSVRDALELLPVAILIVDGNGQMVLANRQTERLFGYGRGELTRTPADVLLPMLGDNGNCSTPGEFFTALRAKVQGRVPDLFAKRRDGTEFPVEIVLKSFRFEEEPALLAVIFDRTERYELHRSRQELAHLTRVSTLGELAGSLAHELNQPLTAILSNVHAAQRFLAADPVDLTEVREILNDIVDDNCRASEVIRRIRAFVKKGDMELAPLDLAGTLRDVVLLVHSDAVVRGIRVTLDVDDDLPEVRGDKVHMQQVMLNLLLNAFDAMNGCPADDRVVAVVVKRYRSGTLRIAVTDRGHGLTVDKLDKIFKPFITSKPQGLGLGLSISRSIIDMHGGELWAENNTDRGATFYVTLPVWNAAGNMQ